MKKILKGIVEILPGEWSLAILQTMRRAWYPQLRRRHQLEESVLDKIGRPDQILAGPFKGMRYISAAYFGSVVPKILGVYEMELNGALETICKAQPDVIVDIGAAEGYYAVGMTKLNPQAKTICFEMYKPAHRLLSRLAQLNGVENRMVLEGRCELESLRDSLESAKRPAVICDCEGGEDFLINPDAVAKLRSAMMIVEIHEEHAPGVASHIRERFKDTHTLQIIKSRKRTPEDLPTKVALSAEEFDAAIYERWATAEWHFLIPNSYSAA
ncbi:MAG TPA: hypothetical protein VGG44_11355 [Tepidisphaeraceae bacterium]|jgi:precorrin-6B methylase 2